MANNTQQIQQLINNAVTLGDYGYYYGDDLQLPDGDVFLYDTVLLLDIHSLKLHGGKKTRFIWKGPADQPMFRFARSYGCMMEGVSFKNDNGLSLCRSAIQITTANNVGNTGGRISSNNRFVDVSTEYGQSNFLDAIEIDSWAYTGSDQNNEFHKFENCTLNGFAQAGVRIRGGQVHQIQFRDCQIHDHLGNGKYGVWCQYGAYFDWIGGTINGSKEADFYIQDFVTRCTIRGLNSEGSRRLLITGGPTGNPLPVRIEDVRWSGRPQQDDHIITYLGMGPLTLDTVNLDTQDTGIPARILVYPPSGEASDSVVSIRNCTFGQNGGVTAPLEYPIGSSETDADPLNIDEFGNRYRWDNRPASHPGPMMNPFWMRWPKDLTRLAVPLPADIPTVFPLSPETYQLDLSQHDFMRGWALQFDMRSTQSPVVPHPHILSMWAGAAQVADIWWLIDVNGNYLGDQIRFEGTGLQHKEQYSNLSYRITMWLDFDRGISGFRIGDREVQNAIASGTPALKLPLTRLMLGSVDQWPRFTGSLTNMKLWNRPLTLEERIG